MLCEICRIRRAKGFIDENDLELQGFRLKRKINACNKCKYLWTAEDIRELMENDMSKMQ